MPCVGPRLQAKRDQVVCEAVYRTQVSLARAQMHAEMYNVECASEHFRAACETANDICDDALIAELHHTAALIHLACSAPYHAATHLDQEAIHLRLAGNYRVIPETLSLAAAAYEQSGNLSRAAARLLRVAKIQFGRQQNRKSWDTVKQASFLAYQSGDDVTQIRLGMLTRLIERETSEGMEPEETFEPIEVETLPPIVAPATK
ncbi:MAG: hypothetical protein AAF989_12785 [Planctomycetota bacterium]